MGWAVGYDTSWQRDVGYGVPAQCDQPGCEAEIDRGLAHVCGSMPLGGETGCGLYFCREHGGGDELCAHLFVRDEGYEPTPDVVEWMRHKLTDESWSEWREQHPEQVAEMRLELSA